MTDRTTQDASEGRPEDWAAPGAALVRSAATDVVPALADLGRVHIMGIAGSGMSGLARILIERGVPVSGCEARMSTTVDGLRALGAVVHVGHSVEHLRDADTFVYTTAINPKHEEMLAARASGKPVLRRAAALEAMSHAAAHAGSRDADVVLARHVLNVVAEYRHLTGGNP